MIFVTHIFSILLLAFGGQVTQTASTLSPVERLKAKIAVESLGTVDKSRLAGHYTNPPRDLVKRIGGVLSGDELYLFPDGTFIYCEWADIQPLTIYDKGRWTFTNGDVELKSDADVTWDPKADRTYVAVRRSHKKEILLVGLHRDLPYFEEQARDDPESMLLIVAKGRRTALTQVESARVKARPFKESWHPDDSNANPSGDKKPRR
jgi:hypothetical protein